MKDEYCIKTVMIPSCVYHMPDTDWCYEIYRIESNKKIKAVLFIWDEYDGYLTQWKFHEKSPEFDNLEELDAYVYKHWIHHIEE